MSSHWYVVINVFNNRMNDDSEPKSAICSIHSVWLWVATNTNSPNNGICWILFFIRFIQNEWFTKKKNEEKNSLNRRYLWSKSNQQRSLWLIYFVYALFFRRSVNLFPPNSLCNRWSSQHFNFIRSIEYKIICISVF